MGNISGRGAPLPSGPRPLVVPILIVGPTQPVEVVVVSHSWLALVCHWYQLPGERCKRTVLCTAPAKCICLSEVGVPVKMHCYLAVTRFSNYLPGILSLTPDGVQSMLGVYPDAVTLRGSTYRLTRSSLHRSSRVKSEASPMRWLRPLMDNFSVLPSLEAIYGKPSLDLWRELHPGEDGIV